MMKLSYLPQLDGLRGLCALAIVLAHFPLVDSSWGDFRYLAIFYRLDYLGVDVFFVLSGFLITRILINDKNNNVSLKYFFIRRSLRIFPIYYLLIFNVWLFFDEEHLIYNALSGR